MGCVSYDPFSEQMLFLVEPLLFDLDVIGEGVRI